MSLLDRIESDLHESIKEKNELRVSTLRLIKSDIMYEKAKTGKDLTEEQVMDVVNRSAKKRREAVSEFTKAGRDDLASKEQLELGIIEEYLPRQLSEDEISAEVDKVLTSVGSVTEKELGKVMGLAMKALKGQADGNIVRKILLSKISK